MKKRDDKKKIREQITEVQLWKDKYLRALADYQNLEKRVAEKREEEERLAIKNFILKLLPVVDDLERAEANLKNEGLSIALKELKNLLRSEQVEKIEVIGKKFDSRMMECVEVEEGEDKDSIVVEQLLPGYKMGDKVIRVAQVKVGK